MPLQSFRYPIHVVPISYLVSHLMPRDAGKQCFINPSATFVVYFHAQASRPTGLPIVYKEMQLLALSSRKMPP